jgi:methionine-gamma-lyase
VYLYSRCFNPSVRRLGAQMAAMEGTAAGYACASGMAAISSALLALCSTGDHIVCSSAVYGGTHALLKTFFPEKCGIATSFVDISDAAAVAAAFTPRTRALYTESVSNPTLVVADLPALASAAHARGAALVVDNTFAPLMLSPAAHGADVVVTSLTKYVSGASDIVAGERRSRTRPPSLSCSLLQPDASALAL